MCCAELERNSHSWATVSSGNIVHEGARSGLHRRHHAGMYSGRPGVVVILYPQEVYFLLAIYVLGSATILRGVAIASLVCSTFYDCCCCCDRMFKNYACRYMKSKSLETCWCSFPDRMTSKACSSCFSSTSPHRPRRGQRNRYRQNKTIQL